MFTLAKLKIWGAAIVGAILAVLGIYLKGRSAGKKAEQQKQVKSELEVEKVKNETLTKASDVAAEVNALPASDVQQRLRDKYTRD